MKKTRQPKFEVGEIVTVGAIGDAQIMKVRNMMVAFCYDIEILDRKDGKLPATLPMIPESKLSKKETENEQE